MIKNSINTNNLINCKNNIIVYNIVRDLGLIPTLKGTKLLISAIQIVISSNNEFIVFEDIYKILARKYINFSPAQIRNAIKYALDTREEEKSAQNFEKIFGFEYDSYYFTNKNIIEEIARIVKQHRNS